MELTKDQRKALGGLIAALDTAGETFNERGESVLDLLQMGYCDGDSVNDFCDGVEAMRRATPAGAYRQFVKRMLGSIDREKATASDQIKRTQFERIGRYGDLEKADADEFANVLQSAGIDPAEYKAFKKGGYKRQSAVQGAEGGGEKHAALLDKYGAP